MLWPMFQIQEMLMRLVWNMQGIQQEIPEFDHVMSPGEADEIHTGLAGH